MKGRIRRQRNFAERVAAFDRAIEKGTGFSRLEKKRWSPGSLFVGTEQHKRLIARKTAGHLAKILIRQERFIKWLEEQTKKPEHYAIVRVEGLAKPVVMIKGKKTILKHGGYQEYFNRPTMEELIKYLRYGKEKPIDNDAFAKCKQLLGRFRGITLEKLEKAAKEFDWDYNYVFGQPEKRSNIIVVGQLKDARLKLAITDY